jgi:hypothetical protein
VRCARGRGSATICRRATVIAAMFSLATRRACAAVSVLPIVRS